MVKQVIPIPPRKCGVCNAEFQPKRVSQIICTQKCFRTFRTKQRDAEFARMQKQLPPDSRVCASCGDVFSDDLLFVTCPNCRRPLNITTGGCQRWGNVDKAVGTTKAISVNTSE